MAHLLHVSTLRIGQRVHIEPQRTNLPRGPKLSGHLKSGPALLTSWIIDLARRGQVHVFSEAPEKLSAEEIENKSAAILKANEELADDEELRLAMHMEEANRLADEVRS